MRPRAWAIRGGVAGAIVSGACARGDRPPVSVDHVVAPAPVVAGSLADATMAVYATIVNNGTAPDTLVAVETPVAASATVHATAMTGGMASMAPAGPVVIAPHAAVRLAPGGMHVMLERLSRAVHPGDSVAVTFVFRKAGRLPVTGRVVSYADLDRALAP